jgi:hypothetical protein
MSGLGVTRKPANLLTPKFACHSSHNLFYDPNLLQLEKPDMEPQKV